MFKARFAVPALSLILTIGSFASPAQAAPDSFALGVKQFGAKTYPLAIASFKKAIAANPKTIVLAITMLFLCTTAKIFQQRLRRMPS